MRLSSLYCSCHLEGYITLFRSITMFCETDNILYNIIAFRLNVRNILQNVFSPTEHLLWIYIILCISQLIYLYMFQAGVWLRS